MTPILGDRTVRATMKTTTIAALALLSSACAPIKFYSYGYDLRPATPPTTAPGLSLAVHGDARNIVLDVVNTSSATARIVWERSSIVMPDGTVSAPLISGQKLIDASKPAAPTVIPSGAKAHVVVSPASSIHFDSYSGWEQTPTFPPEKQMTGGFQADDKVSAFGGKSLRLMVYVEHPAMRSPEVSVALVVARIARQRCTYVETDCHEFGEVWPKRTPVPPDPQHPKAAEQGD